MPEVNPMLIAKGKQELYMLPRMSNRHGLVAGATGTGKTVTLQVIAENLSKIGVPVFMADVKGDLSGVSRKGTEENTRVTARIQQLQLKDFAFSSCPVTFWDVYGEQGHPVRTTVSAMGPLLFSRLLDLNETQAGVLSLVFKIADDKGYLLLDLKDMRAMLQFVGDNAKTFQTEYGQVSGTSIGAIQRGLLALEAQGGDKFFGEPALELTDLIKVDSSGQGMINILAADKLMQAPKVYTTFLLWLLSELFEHLPEIGDPDKPKLAFFFDEAHLIFSDAPQALLEKIEQVVRLVRSKGVGVYFISQNPNDIPDVVLGQLGNRVQHALHAFTPRDQKAVKAAAQTFRSNPDLDVEKTIGELEVGEALVSFLDAKATPGIVDRAFIVPPHSQIGAITPEQRQQIIKQSAEYGKYEKLVDRESAFEMLKARAADAADAADAAKTAAQATAGKPARKASGRAPKPEPSAVESLAKGAAGALNSPVGREIVRGVLGSFLGGSTTSRRR